MRGRAVSAARTGGIEPRPSDSEFYQRNLAEYEGRSEVDERLLTDFIDCTTRLEAAVAVVDPPAKNYRAAIFSAEPRAIFSPIRSSPPNAFVEMTVEHTGRVCGATTA
jgi:hypothetical protein